MNMGPSVVVRRSGFLSAVAYGFFGLLTTAVICGTVIGLNALWMFDGTVRRAVDVGSEVVGKLSDWKSLPPVVADMLNDVRAPEYRENIGLKVRVATEGASRHSDGGTAVLEVHNRGDETISMLAVRVVAEDAAGTPLSEQVVYVATPAAFDDKDFPGTLLPGQTRKVRVCLPRIEERGALTAEVSDLRIWRGEAGPSKADNGTVTAGEMGVVAGKQ